MIKGRGNASVYPCPHCLQTQVMYLQKDFTNDHYGICFGCGFEISREKWKVWCLVVNIEDEKKVKRETLY